MNAACDICRNPMKVDRRKIKKGERLVHRLCLNQRLSEEVKRFVLGLNSR